MGHPPRLCEVSMISERLLLFETSHSKLWGTRRCGHLSGQKIHQLVILCWVPTAELWGTRLHVSEVPDCSAPDTQVNQPDRAPDRGVPTTDHSHAFLQQRQKRRTNHLRDNRLCTEPEPRGHARYSIYTICLTEPKPGTPGFFIALVV